MDRNSVIGLLLIGALLIGYTWYNRPSEAELAEQQRIQDSIATAQQEADLQVDAEPMPSDRLETELAPADTLGKDSLLMQEQEAEMQARYGVFAGAATGSENFVHVETEKLKLKFSNKGGFPVYAELKNFTTYDSLPLIVISEKHANMGVEFTYPSLGNLNTQDFYFEASENNISISGEEESSLVFTIDIPGRGSIKNVYHFKGDGYDFDYTTRFENLDGVVTAPELKWELSALHNEKGIESERNNSTIFYKEADHGRDYLSETSDDDEIIEDENLEWIAFKQNFFSAILIGNEGFGRGSVLKSKPYSEENDSLTQYYSAKIPLVSNGDGVAFTGKFFIGPNDYKTLKAYGKELDKVINLGWGIFGWVNKYIVITIFDWLEQTGLSYGIIILILTLVIKLILSPLTFKNYMSSAKMRVLKPEIDELNEKHKDADPMKKQQATMDLYRKTGVSPFAGCIPMLIQLPILYAMFRFFPSSIQLRHEPFLWADDLSAYDSVASLPFTIPFYGDHVSLFTLLMAASTMIYTIYNSNQMPTQSQPGMPNMKVIMYIFPVMMLFFFNSFASGLSYYYFLANLISIIQMLVIKNFFIDEDKIRAKIAENKKKKAKQGKSKFQKKLEEMAKQRGLNTK